MKKRRRNLSTEIARAGERQPSLPGHPLAPPLMLASVYAYRDLDEFSDAARHKTDAWFYRRYGHLNGRLLEEAMAGLEGGEEAVACGSGMAAEAALFSSLVKRSDHVVAVGDMYGGTVSYLQQVMPPAGVAVEFVRGELDSVRRALRPNTRVVVLETITNPLMGVPDFPAIVRLARKVHALVVVDNTFATPVLCRPLDWGADVVVHSGTKFLNGHGDAVSGVVVSRREIIRRVRRHAITVGGTISPMDAWLTLRGLRTLSLRVERASENALALARWLSRQRKVVRVHYPGLPSRASHARAKKYLRGGFGPMLSFELAGGVASVKRFVRGCSMLSLAASLGDVATTLSHPARSSHSYLSERERHEMGITDGLIRVSTGIENVEDIINDVDGGLKSI